MLEATVLAFGASITCLAQAIYFEARDQPTVGQMAVAQVVLNRTHDSRWPNTICGVVKEGPTYSWKQIYPVKHRCQFSFYCDGLSDVPKDKRSWNKAISIAEEVHYTYGLSIPLLDGAVFYHSINVDPQWNRQYLIQIEDHIFYK